MTPVGRAGFVVATIGCAVLALLLLSNASIYLDLADSGDPFSARPGKFEMSMVAIVVSIGVAGLLWTWFLARRFLALEIRRWLALLPVAACMLGLTVLFTTLDEAMEEWRGEVPESVTRHPLDSPERREAFDEWQAGLKRDARIRPYLGVFSAILTLAGAILAVFWFARGLRRDPIPVEEHFS
jgi:hypothetical protein